MFVSGKPYEPNLMFVGETRSLPLSGAPERCFARVGSGFTSYSENFAFFVTYDWPQKRDTDTDTNTHTHTHTLNFIYSIKNHKTIYSSAICSITIDLKKPYMTLELFYFNIYIFSLK